MSVIDNSNLGTLWNRILGLFTARKINNKSLAKDITINDEDIPSTAVNGETTVEGALGNIADQLSNQSRQIDELGPDNTLTSDSMTKALAAAQGKALKALIDGMKWTTVKQVNYYTSQTSLFYTGCTVTIPANSIYVLIGQTIFNNSNPTLACFSHSNNPAFEYNIINRPANGCGITSICGLTGTTAETFYLLGIYTAATQDSAVISGAYAAL